MRLKILQMELPTASQSWQVPLTTRSKAKSRHFHALIWELSCFNFFFLEGSSWHPNQLTEVCVLLVKKWKALWNTDNSGDSINVMMDYPYASSCSKSIKGANWILSSQDPHIPFLNCFLNYWNEKLQQSAFIAIPPIFQPSLQSHLPPSK